LERLFDDEGTTVCYYSLVRRLNRWLSDKEPIITARHITFGDGGMPNEEIRLANIENVLQTSIGLFIENGIHNTSREMIARASGLSRRSTERYFPSMSDCVEQTAIWFGSKLYQNFRAREMLQKGNYPASEILKVFLDELKQIAYAEPRILVCFAEFKAYLYRHSKHRDSDYRKFVGAVGCRSILQRIFELGEEDGTVRYQNDPEADARYLMNMIMSCFATAVLIYDTQPELMRQYIETYVSDAWRLYCGQEK
jgi:AcrR family transcriptional regulator